MHIHIKSKKSTVNAKVASTNSQKILGLMFKRKIGPMFFEFNRESKYDSSVHTLFVFQPIDLVYLDSNWKVVDIIKTKQFFPYYAPKTPAKYLLELPQRMGEHFKIGEKLEYEYY